MFLVAGAFALSLIVLGTDRLVLSDAEGILSRYALVIGAANVAFASTVLGIFFAKGHIRSWFRADLDVRERAQLTLLSVGSSAPTLVCMGTLFVEHGNSSALSLFLIMVYGWLAVSVVDALRTLRN